MTLYWYTFFLFVCFIHNTRSRLLTYTHTQTTIIQGNRGEVPCPREWRVGRDSSPRTQRHVIIIIILFICSFSLLFLFCFLLISSQVRKICFSYSISPVWCRVLFSSYCCCAMIYNRVRGGYMIGLYCHISSLYIKCSPEGVMFLGITCESRSRWENCINHHIVAFHIIASITNLNWEFFTYSSPSKERLYNNFMDRLY